MINAAALKLIESFESFQPKEYYDGYGYLTIGWGHRVLSKEDWHLGITRDQADDVLEADLTIAEEAVVHAVTAALNENQFGALVSFTFNTGAGTLERATFTRLLNTGDYLAVPKGLKLYVYAGHPPIISHGLVRRREAEAALFLLPVVA
ncbi:MAG TPA: lysozyme [Rhodanobacter sp.]|nr:lysozyme [Rhodanobacter sp.]